MKQLGVITAIAAVCFVACSRSNQSPAATSATSSVTPSPADYTPRIGIAVSTNARTCMAIRNGDLTTGSTVTLISPLAPVTSTTATVSGVAQQACPITQNVDTTVSNYNVTPQGQVQKQTPMIVVVGSPAVAVNNNVGQADLDQNGHTESFRACSAANGVHLTVWSGVPLQSTLLWHGYYYEPGNPSVGPSCTSQEVPAT